MISTEVQDKVFGITAAFESRSGYGTVSGNGDGMLLRAGILQWSLGMATLQPLLKEIHKRSPEMFVEHLGPTRGRLLEGLASGTSSWRDAAVELTGSALVARARDLLPAWRSGVSAIMASPVGVQVQRDTMAPMLEQAWKWCQDYGVQTERALSLFLDIRMQNGSIEPHCRSVILDRFSRDTSEHEKLSIIASERSAAVRGRLRGNVLSRKMCIVTGKGEVDGRAFDLERDFGLTDDKVLEG
jgi:hypothetical protein